MNNKESLNEEMFLVLLQLVSLKDYKDIYGKDDYYLNEQPLLWEKAKKVINNTKTERNEPLGKYKNNNTVEFLDDKLSPEMKKNINISQEILDEFQAICGIPAELFKKPENHDYYEQYMQMAKKYGKIITQRNLFRSISIVLFIGFIINVILHFTILK